MLDWAYAAWDAVAAYFQTSTTAASAYEASVAAEDVAFSVSGSAAAADAAGVGTGLAVAADGTTVIDTTGAAVSNMAAAPNGAFYNLDTGVLIDPTTGQSIAGVVVDPTTGSIINSTTGTVMDNVGVNATGQLINPITNAALDPTQLSQLTSEGAAGQLGTGAGGGAFKAPTGYAMGPNTAGGGLTAGSTSGLGMGAGTPLSSSYAANTANLTGGAAGAAGGMSQYLGALKTANSMLGIGSAIGNILNPGVSPSAAQQAANPNAPYQAQYAKQLNDLVANPALVTGSPGYQFNLQQGYQGLNRNLARGGMGSSMPGAPGTPAAGAAGMAQQVYGQNYAGNAYNQQVSNLQNLSNTGASAGANAMLTAQQQAQAAAQAGYQALGQGVGSLMTSYQGGQSSTPAASSQVSPGGWNAPTYTPDYSLYGGGSGLGSSLGGFNPNYSF